MFQANYYMTLAMILIIMIYRKILINGIIKDHNKILDQFICYQNYNSLEVLLFMIKFKMNLKI